MDRDEDLVRAVQQRDIDAISKLMFEMAEPSVRAGFRSETELWDFKNNLPSTNKNDALGWAHVAADILAFHNTRGGIIVFGITDDFNFSGVDRRFDSKLFNDQLRKYLGDRIWVEFHRHFIQPDQRYLGIVLVPPRGPIIERFRSDSPESFGLKYFSKGDSAVRDRDSTRILRNREVDVFVRQNTVPTLGRLYSVDEPYFRILSPEYAEFIERPEPCRAIETALHNPRTAVASIVGIGGVGKTALATWAALKAYEKREFAFIVSITAKDRELSSTGILALKPALTSFESLLNSVAEVTGFRELKLEPVEKREHAVRDLLKDSNGLVFVDNLETVDDSRIIQFLDDLPLGVRALTTSRRTSVRISVHPVDLGTLKDDEMLRYVTSLRSQLGCGYVSELSPAECKRIGQSCDGIPLAIRWTLSRSKSASEAVDSAGKITTSNRHGEELLEFCFRRVFESLSGPEKDVLQVLALFQRPLTQESILVGSKLPHLKVADAIEGLIGDALVQRMFDTEKNDYCYSVLPMTRAFVYGTVRQNQIEEEIRQRLTDWFEAKDVKDSSERLVVREIRQGKESPESALLDLAQAAERRKDMDSALALYDQALQRSPKSWKAARLLAELYRHRLGKTSEAIRLYEQAAANAPRRGPERALIFREWGMLLRESGEPEATDLAIEKFETALAETPNDVLAIHALAHMLERKGMFARVIELLEPLKDHPQRTTREKTLPLLLNAYERTGDILKAAETRNLM